MLLLPAGTSRTQQRGAHAHPPDPVSPCTEPTRGHTRDLVNGKCFSPHGIYLYCWVLFESMEGAQDCLEQVWDTCTDPKGWQVGPAAHQSKTEEHHVIPCSTRVRKALRWRAKCEPKHQQLSRFTTSTSGAQPW